MRRRILAAILALALSLTLLPTAAWAGTATSGKCGDFATWSFDSKTGTLTIDGQGAMEDYDHEWVSPVEPQPEPWAVYAEEIRTVVIGKDITRVGNEAFSGGAYRTNPYPKLKTITFAKNSQLTEIGDYAFTEANQVEEITLPAKLKTLGYSALPVNYLRAVYVDGGNRTFYSDNGVLYWKDELRHYPRFRDADTYSILAGTKALAYDAMGGGNGNYFLSAITVPGSVERIPDGFFSFCDSLSTVTLEEGIREIGSLAFVMSPQLKEVVIPASVTAFTTEATPADAWEGDRGYALYFKGSAAPAFDAGFTQTQGDQPVTIYYPFDASGWDEVMRQTDVREQVQQGCLVFRGWDPGDTPVTPPSGEDTLITRFVPRNNAVDVKYTGYEKTMFEISFNRDISGVKTRQGYHFADLDFSAGSFCVYCMEDGQKIYEMTRDESINKFFQIEGSFSADAEIESGNTLRVSPSDLQILDPGKRYCVTVDEGFIRFEDGTVNPRIDYGEWTFTTQLLRKHGKFSFASSDGKDKQYKYFYSDDFFMSPSIVGNAGEYNHELGVMSLSMAMAAFNSTDTTERYDEMTAAKNIRQLLEDLNFDTETIDTSSYAGRPQMHSIAAAFGNKKVAHGSEEFTLVAVAVRGGGYGAEWGGNFTVGEGTNEHLGFHVAASNVIRLLKRYINDCGITGKVKLWITGYSRAAATANLAAAAIDRGELFEGKDVPQNISLKAGDIYAYTFATPRGTTTRFQGGQYRNIFNIINPIDLVPKVAPQGWSFSRYGTDYLIPTGSTTSTRYSDVLMDVMTEYTAIMRGSAGGTKLGIPQFSNQAVILDEIIAAVSREMSRDDYSPKYEHLFVPIIAETSDMGNVQYGEEIMLALCEFGIRYPKEVAELIEKIQKVMGKKALWYIVGEQGVEQALDVLIGNGTTAVDIIKMMGNIISCAHYPEVTLAWMRTLQGADEFGEKTYRKLRVNCPVNVSVYEGEQLVAQIIDNEPVLIAESTIAAYVDGREQKVFILPADAAYTVKVDATDDGEVSYLVEEVNLEEESSKKVVSYENIQIHAGDTLKGVVESLDKTENARYPLYVNGQDTPLKPGDQEEQDEPEHIVSPKVERTYTVIVQEVQNGTVTAKVKSAAKGDRVTVTAVPDAGYVLADLTVSDKNGEELSLTEAGENTFTFKMPASKVLVEARFTEIEQEPAPIDELPFVDVSAMAWYAGDVAYVCGRELMGGTSANTFSPDETMTRAMLMTVLARLDGVHTTAGRTWYEAGMTWAVYQGISDGSSPEAPVTREQMAAMLYRFAGSPQAEGTLAGFSDGETVAPYAQNAMRWAVGMGIINGMEDGSLRPRETANRAQVAAILARFCRQTGR